MFIDKKGLCVAGLFLFKFIKKNQQNLRKN